jgi:hypothetical protein
MPTKTSAVVLVVAVAILALCAPAANAQPALSKNTASGYASSYASRESHRIWRLRDIGVEAEASMCHRRSSYLLDCAMKVSLYYDGSLAPPTEVEGTLAVHRLTSGRVTTRLVREWELLPPPHGRPESAAEREETVRFLAEAKKQEETALREEEAKLSRENEEAAARAAREEEQRQREREEAVKRIEAADASQ